ncbi:MAG TPA: VCBS repeat-containing protein [Tepidisphaeraceae bacterium]|jgi:hypothetical protein
MPSRTLSSALLLSVALTASPAIAGDKLAISPDLSPPVQIQAGEKPIDVEIGHAAPCFADIDKDGKPDLLVGQFGNGQLRIYKNVGSETEPKFDSFQWFRGGEKLGTIPAS